MGGTNPKVNAANVGNHPQIHKAPVMSEARANQKRIPKRLKDLRNKHKSHYYRP